MFETNLKLSKNEWISNDKLQFKWGTTKECVQFFVLNKPIYCYERLSYIISNKRNNIKKIGKNNQIRGSHSCQNEIRNVDVEKTLNISKNVEIFLRYFIEILQNGRKNMIKLI